MKKFKIDLHLHTNASYDAVITFEDLKKAYDIGKFDAVAITDHGTIANAVAFAKRNEFPVIIGEEIETLDGDIIGLFLKKEIAEHQEIWKTMLEVHAQGGLVCVPHPFDALKSGLREEKILQILGAIDLFETHNWSYGGGILKRDPEEILAFAKKHRLIAIGGSDAHIPMDIGRGFLEFTNVDKKILQEPQIFLQKCKSAIPKMSGKPNGLILLKHLANFPYMRKSFLLDLRCLARAFLSNLRQKMVK